MKLLNNGLMTQNKGTLGDIFLNVKLLFLRGKQQENYCVCVSFNKKVICAREVSCLLHLQPQHAAEYSACSANVYGFYSL